MNRPDEDELDPRAALELLGDTDRRVRERLDVDQRILLGAWGVAWLVGYGAIWWDTRAQSPYTGPEPWSLATMGVLMLAALVTTVVMVQRAVSGLGGPGATSGLMWGLTWPLAFTGNYALLAAAVRHDAGEELIAILSGGGPAVIVGILYLAGAALWRDWTFFGLGAWIVLVTSAAVLTGPVTYTLVMAVAGGLGFLAVAAWFAGRRRR